MDTEKSIETLESVCAQFRGTLQEHQIIQASLNTIKEALKPKKEEKKDDGVQEL